MIGRARLGGTLAALAMVTVLGCNTGGSPLSEEYCDGVRCDPDPARFFSIVNESDVAADLYVDMESGTCCRVEPGALRTVWQPLPRLGILHFRAEVDGREVASVDCQSGVTSWNSYVVFSGPGEMACTLGW